MGQAVRDDLSVIGERLSSTDGPDWWMSARASSFASIERIGLPGKRDDAWWGASPGRFFNTEWSARAVGPVASVFPFPGLPQWVFVDGQSHSKSTDDLPEGVSVRTFRQAFDDGVDLSGVLGSTCNQGGETIDELSMVLHQDGLWIEVEEGVVFERPLVLVHASSANEGAVGLRVVVHLAKGASLRLVEHWCGDTTELSTALTEVVLADDATLDWVKIETHGERAKHVQTIRANLGARSVLNVTSLGLGARLSRTEMRIRLQGRQAKANLAGLTLGRQDQVQDHYVWVDHEVPDCHSNQLFRSLSADRSRGLFTGRVVVHPDAQQTLAEQQHDGLLLSEGAVTNARPQLEIYADDVSCRHGATVGQMDEDALFYLQQRGIGLSQARQLLLRAFAGAVFSELPDDGVRTHLVRLADQWLANAEHAE